MQSSAIAEYRAKYPECTKFKRLNWKESERYFKKIAKSKTYKELCAKEDASRYGRLDPQRTRTFSWCNCGQATSWGTMRLAKTNCPYTIVHEFAYTSVVICTMTLVSVGM